MVHRPLVGFVLVLLLAGSAEAQSRLNFPRVLPLQELRTTGFGLVNTASSPVVANFTFYGIDGQIAGSSGLSVPAGGQVAKLGSDIFTSANASGWVQVTSSSSELQGFELVGDFATVSEGTGPAPESTQLAVIDFSREDVIHIVNTASQAGTVQITLHDANGGTLHTRSVALARFQPFSLRLGDANDDDNIDLVSLSADVQISASITSKLSGGRDIAVTNAVPILGAPSDLLFPFAPIGAQGSSNWTTFIGVSNLAAASQTVSIIFTPDGGAPVTIQRTLAPRASLGDSVGRLFDLSANVLTAGWLRVYGSGPLAGVVAYQDSAAGSLATVPSQSVGANRFFFGHIASLAPWYTGVALLNTNPVAASVEVFAIDSSGQLVGSPAAFSLAGGSRRSALLSELVPQVLQRSVDGGFVFVRTTNGISLYGFELFGHSIFPILANVQGFALSSTSTFAPPSGGGTTAPITLDRVTFTDGTNSKGQFRPQDTIVYVATVTNSSGASVSGQMTYDVKDPRGQVMLTTSTSLTLPVGSIDLPFSSFIPSNALNGQYTLTATLSYQKQTVTKSGVFDVTGGTTTPGLVQEAPFSTSTLDLFRVAFRPGDVARFVVLTSNFVSPVADAALNYQLIGPGGFIAGIGSLSYAVSSGLSSRTIDVTLPASSPLGIYAFFARLTAGGTTSSKGTAITIAPASSTETADVDTVFVTDSDGVPRAGFTPGGNTRLYVSRLSLFAVTTPATIRYTVTGPNSSSVADQQLAVNLTTGQSLGFLPLGLSSSAVTGTYTFQATLTYLDNTNTTKTSTLSTQFTVANIPPILTRSISVRRLHVADYNFVARTLYSPGEFISLTRTVYSTFTTSVAGTVRYLVMLGQNTAFDRSFDTTFFPGVNTSFLLLSGSSSLPAGTYTFNLTATAQGQQSTSSTSFLFTGPPAPTLNFDRFAGDAKSSSAEDKQTQKQVQETTFDLSVEDGSDSTQYYDVRGRWLRGNRK